MSSSEVTNKTVWITGASSGLGEAMARVFADAGARIILSGRREQALHEVADSIEQETKVIAFEATDFSALPDVVALASEWRGGIDILINNAGITQRSIALDTLPEVYQRIIDVDLLAPIWLTQLVLPGMVSRGGGHIVAISSVAGRFGAPMRTAYSAAKHGLIGYMDALRTEIESKHEMYVTNILPGSFRTNIARNALTATGAVYGTSDEIIEHAPAPAECAREVLAAVVARQPERIIAQEIEAQLCQMRFEQPEELFTLLGELAVQQAAMYELAD